MLGFCSWLGWIDLDLDLDRQAEDVFELLFESKKTLQAYEEDPPGNHGQATCLLGGKN